MKRLTSNNYHEMDMVHLALNQVYIKDNWAWYVRGPEDRLSVCGLLRSAAETLGVELPILSDYELSDLLTDWLQYGEKEPEGVLAILDRALWAMAELRERLAAYEDAGLEPEEIPEQMVPLPPVCYKEDGGECAYQTYDGTDEPIDECKECPLCCVDKQRHQQPPNAPLTLEDLREMDGEPVWIVESPDWGHWELSADAEDYVQDRDEDFYGMKHDDPHGKYGLHALGWLAYRRKPEEG